MPDSTSTSPSSATSFAGFRLQLTGLPFAMNAEFAALLLLRRCGCAVVAEADAVHSVADEIKFGSRRKGCEQRKSRNNDARRVLAATPRRATLLLLHARRGGQLALELAHPLLHL